MNKHILKAFLSENKYLILWLLFMVIMPIEKSFIANMIMFIFTLKVFNKFGSKDFKMFISLSCTRKKYYINTIKTSLINSLFFSIVCTTLNFYESGINNIKNTFVVFLFYFIFYILFSSVEIFIEVLSISQYVAVEFGVLFLYFVLYIRFILPGPIIFGDTQWILKEFVPYSLASLVSICFNMFMSTIALKTTEI